MKCCCFLTYRERYNLRRLLHVLLAAGIGLTTLFLATQPACAEIRTITATGEYTMGEAETPLVAKERAAIQAMRSASEQAGVYLESMTVVKDMQLVKDEVLVLTSAVLEVLDKKYTQRLLEPGGIYFTCTITARVDTSNIEKMRDRVRDKQALDTLKKVREDYAKAQQEIEVLKQKLTAAHTEIERKTIQDAVARNEEILTALQWIERGFDLAVNRKDYVTSIEAFTKAIALDPESSTAYYNRGISYYKIGQHDRAIADYDRAIAITPRAAAIYTNRGAAFDAKKQFDQAIADYDRAIDLDPRDSTAYYNRGRYYHKIGQLGRAIADYDQAIALDPRNAGAYNNRGAAFTDKGQLDWAIADYNRAIALDPRNTEAYSNRGTIYVKIGQFDRAIADFDQAIALDPRNAEAYYNKAYLCEKTGRTKEAIQAYRAFIQYAPPVYAPQIQHAWQRIAALGG